MAPSTPSRQSSPLPLKRKATTGPTYTFAPLTPQFSDASAVCIGTGRFLRAVLVPALHELGCGVVLAQTRGTSFCAHMAECTEYEVDTVATDGSVQTTSYTTTGGSRTAASHTPSQVLFTCFRTMRK